MSLLLGCSTGEGATVTPATPGAISFGKVSTRAGEASTRVDNASEIEEFSVWATVSSKNSDGTSINPAVSYLPILENERVYRNPAGSDNWTYDNEQLWVSNSYFHFFAAYPYNLGFEQIRQELDNGQMFTAYMLNVTADGTDATKDILVATKVVDTDDEFFDEATPVDVQFGHLLTKVNIKIRQNFDIAPDFNFYVKKVTISGIKRSGSYGLMPYNTSFYPFWNLEDSATLTIEKVYDEPRILRNEGAADPTVVLSVWDDGLMLIPQEIATNTILVRVDYLYDVDLNDDDLGEEKFIEVYIPATNLWQSGNSLGYSLSITDSSFITFDQPTIEPWGAPQTGGTIIIK